MDSIQKETDKLNKEIERSWLIDEDIQVGKHLFSDKTEEELDNPTTFLLKIFLNPDNFYFTCKYVLNIELLPFQVAILKELWTKKYPMLIATRGFSKSWLLAVYALLRALLCPGAKVVIVGSGFRQSKLILEYAERIWNNAPVLRSMAGYGNDKAIGPHHGTDEWNIIFPDSFIKALPIGDGEKIRGQRATHIICDEFKSQNVEIFETVIAGFGSVSANPVEGVKTAARIKKMKKLGLWSESQQENFDKQNFGNQVILSGTAYYVNNHFYKYWERYRQIVNSKGDPKKIREIFSDKPPEHFNYKDYCVMRIPFELMPEGFMDEKNVALSRALSSSGNYNVEYGAVFAKDSDGFFRRSLIDSCTAPIKFLTGEKIHFSAMIRGNPHGKYVYAIDPAADKDNFAVVLLELHGTHRRAVYCWTTNRMSHRQKIKDGLVSELDFYGYAVRKIRDLMKSFPCERIMCDSQGGGVAVEEAFHDLDKINPDEKLIWRVVDPDKEHWTDDKEGLHILEMVNFSDASWVSEANHGMKKDMEDKALVFPEFDHIVLGLAAEEDNKAKRLYDTLEDCACEIEDMKDELTTIVMTQTGNSQRDRWDTPEIKKADNKKGRLRKDRYSALLMANMGARIIARTEPEGQYNTAVGGFLGSFSKLPATKDMYAIAPEWMRNEQRKNNYKGGRIFKRG